MEFSFDDFLEGLWDAPRSQWVKWVHKNLSDNHCEVCLKIDNCWFLRSKAPPWPHHPYCHCALEPISFDVVLKNITADSEYSKFDPFLFNTNKKYDHGKEKMFNDWGYYVTDSNYLKSEFIKQALDKYASGNYILGKLDKNGQRISIRVEINRKDKEGTVSFITGWMVRPNGHLQLATPYGGE